MLCLEQGRTQLQSQPAKKDQSHPAYKYIHKQLQTLQKYDIIKMINPSFKSPVDSLKLAKGTYDFELGFDD